MKKDKKIWRNAKTWKFVKVKETQKKPKTTLLEKVPNKKIKPSKEFKVGRDAINWQFIKVEDAKKRKDTAIVETIRKPTKRKVNKKK